MALNAHMPGTASLGRRKPASGPGASGFSWSLQKAVRSPRGCVAGVSAGTGPRWSSRMRTSGYRFSRSVCSAEVLGVTCSRSHSSSAT